MPCDAVEEAAANRNDSEMSQLSAWIFRFCAPTSEPLAQHSDSLVKVSQNLHIAPSSAQGVQKSVLCALNHGDCKVCAQNPNLCAEGIVEVLTPNNITPNSVAHRIHVSMRKAFHSASEFRCREINACGRKQQRIHLIDRSKPM